MTNTIEDILKSEKSDNYSNIRILPSIKSNLLGAIKDEKRPSQRKRIQKLKETIYNVKHKAFVKCIEWTSTCDAVELSNRGVM